MGLLALVPGIAMTFMDQTILPVALPAIQRDFAAGSVALQWAVNAYLLTIAILVLVGGKLCDHLGPRRSLLIGLTLFAASSALCSLSQNIQWLIFARVLQGVGAAFLVPTQNAFIAKLFPPARRGKAMGLMVSLGAIFSMTAPLLGGYLVQTLSWHWIFWINLPVALAGWVLTCLYLPSIESIPTKIDIRGFVYFACGSAALTIALMEGGGWGWSAWPLYILFSAALLCTALLVRREKTAQHPFFDLTLFRHPRFAASNLSIIATQFILITTVFRAIYFQNILHYTPFETGFFTFIAGLPLLIIPSVAGFLSDRIGPKTPILLGFLFLIGSNLSFGFFSTPSTPLLLATSALFGTGLAFVFTPSYSSGISSIPPKKVGVGSGIIATFRSLSASAGIAIIGALFGSIQNARLIHTPHLPPLPADQLTAIAQGTMQIAQTAVSTTERAFLVKALREAHIQAFSQVHLLLAFFIFVSLIAFLLVYHRKTPSHLEYPLSEGWDG